MESSQKEYVVIINKIRDIVRKLEANLKYSRDLEAIRFLRYSVLKSKKQILTDDLKKAKIRNKQMLNLFRQSVTDVQLSSIDILPETLKRQVQKTWHQKYDTLLSQNDRLKKQILSMDCIMKEKQKQIDILQQRLLNIAENVNSGHTEKICRRCWILRNED